MTLTCESAADLLDAFVDAELPPSTSVEVARHAGQCVRCDGIVRDMLVVREALLANVDAAVERMDLGGVWSRVEAEMGPADAQRAWRERAAVRRGGVSRGVAWSAMAAMAAGALLAFRLIGPTATVPDRPGKDGSQPNKRVANHVVIDRLAGKDINVYREKKSGTTMIWVNHEVESNGW